MTNRRALLVAGLGAAALPLVARFAATPALAAGTQQFPYRLTPAQWQAKLGPAAYAVLREDATERPFSSPLNEEHRTGTFSCKGCANPLYSSKTKFDSGTGWPSFYAPLPKAVVTSRDTSYFMDRTAVSCARCGGHLGHVFDDGPKPTGLRYCMNGVAMTFTPAKA